MRYAPIGGGVDPALIPITPRIGAIGAKPQVWARAAAAARRFWMAVSDDDVGLPVPAAFRALAVSNLAVIEDFIAPLLPGPDGVRD